jgi:transposase InsO family protein
MTAPKSPFEVMEDMWGRDVGVMIVNQVANLKAHESVFGKDGPKAFQKMNDSKLFEIPDTYTDQFSLRCMLLPWTGHSSFPFWAAVDIIYPERVLCDNHPLDIFLPANWRQNSEFVQTLHLTLTPPVPSKDKLQSHCAKHHHIYQVQDCVNHYIVQLTTPDQERVLWPLFRQGEDMKFKRTYVNERIAALERAQSLRLAIRANVMNRIALQRNPWVYYVPSPAQVRGRIIIQPTLPVVEGCTSLLEEYATVTTEISAEVYIPGEFACVSSDKQKESAYKVHANTWLADSGASTHMGHCDQGMFDVEFDSTPVKIGDGKYLKGTRVGKKRCTVVQKDGSTLDVVLTGYKHVPSLWVNLFSIPRALEGGFNIGNKGKTIFIFKDQMKIEFDRTITTGKGSVMAVDMMPRVEHANPAASIDQGSRMEINKFHKLVGHPSEETLRNTAKFYGLQLVGKVQVCEDCKVANARQKDVAKETHNQSDKPGERLFIDISSIKTESYGGRKFWLLIVDDCTDVAWSAFLRTKSSQVDRIVTFIKDLQARHTIKVKYIRCDNAGENKSLEVRSQKEALAIEFEYTPTNSPQFNGKVERKFATLFTRVRSFFVAAHIPRDIREKLWPEAGMLATDVENALVPKRKDQASYNTFFKKELPGLRYLRQFGEVAIAKDTRKIKGKLEDRGKATIYLGIAKNHSPDVYRLMNLKTRAVINSRDVIWLNKTYGEWKGLVNKPVETQGWEDIELFDGPDEEQVVINNQVQSAQPEPEGEPEEMPQPRQELRGLVARNITEETLAERIRENLEAPAGVTTRGGARTMPNTETASAIIDRMIDDRMCGDYDIGMSVTEVAEPPSGINPEQFKDIFDEPETFDQAWNHPDPFLRMKWREAILDELKIMEARKVWKKVKRNTMPKGKRCVKHRWVFNIKRSGTFKARLVACGYSQVPGIDFTEIYSPVSHDVTFRILLIVQILWKLTAKQLDIGSAFLYGDLKEEIYMECPEGLDHLEDEVVLLIHSIYGLVQSARAYFRKWCEKLKSIGFQQSPADPCLFIRYSDKGIVMMVIHVDDVYAIGTNESIDEAVSDIRNTGFTVKVEDDTSDYLSCEIAFSKDKSKAWIGQPHLLKKLESKFGELVSGMTKYHTPGTPGAGLLRPKSEEDKIDTDKQTLYRSGVGMLMYLYKHTRPDLSNAVRELTKCMDGATEAAFKEMKRIIKFVLDTKTFGLKLHPISDKELKWELTVYSDSDWAGDKEDRRSIGGFVIFLNGALIMWRSRAQKSVALSSSEAEFYALSEAAKEIKFIAQVLLSMGISVQLPIYVNVDNIGAIFMTENASTSSRSRHMDTRYHFTREMQDEGLIKVIFVKSADNYSDGWTKNVKGEVYEAHLDKFVAERSYL